MDLDVSMVFQMAGIGIVTFAAEQFLVNAGLPQYAGFAKIAGATICTLMIVEQAVKLFGELAVFARW